MKRFFFVFALFSLFFAGEAAAQFKHHSIGLHLGFQNTFNQGGDPLAKAGTIERSGYGVGFSYFDVGIDYTFKFVERFATVTETHLSFHSCGNPTGGICAKDSTPIMISAMQKIRAYLLTDEVRPYFDLGLGYWRSLGFVTTTINAFGPGVAFGLDWFFKEDFVLGFKLQYNLQIFVGETSLVPFHQVAFMLTFSLYP